VLINDSEVCVDSSETSRIILLTLRFELSASVDRSIAVMRNHEGALASFSSSLNLRLNSLVFLAKLIQLMVELLLPAFSVKSEGLHFSCLKEHVLLPDCAHVRIDQIFELLQPSLHIREVK
jgi:hypothetical protein